MTTHVFHTYPESSNRWRPYEREELERRLGKVVEHGITGARYEPMPETGDVCYWKLHAERTTSVGLATAVVMADRMTRIGCRMINPPRAFLTVHAKDEAFLCWEHYGVAHPRWAFLNDAADADDLDLRYPLLVRLNDSVTGEHSIFVATKQDAWLAYLKLSTTGLRDMTRRWGAGICRRIIAVEFHETATQEHRVRVSYRIIVAGGRVITGYARLAEPPDWIAIASKFTPALAAEWMRANGACQRYMVEREGEIVNAVRAIGQDFVGVDVIPLPDGRHLFLEAQPDFSCGNAHAVGDPLDLLRPLMWHESLYTSADGGLDLGARFPRPAPCTYPPFYNPSHPTLVEFLLSNMREVRRRCPLYADQFLDKQILFRVCWDAIAKGLGR